MLTSKTYKYLAHHFFISSVLCIMPFVWDAKRRRVTSFKSKLGILLWYFNNLQSTVFGFWVMRCFVLGVVNGNRHVSLLTMDVLMGMTYVGEFFWQGTIVLMREDIAELISQLLSFDTMLTERYKKVVSEGGPEAVEETGGGGDAVEGDGPGKEQKKGGKGGPALKEGTDGCDVNIFMSIYMMFVYAGMYVSLFLRNPYNERFLYGAVMREVLDWDERTQADFYAVYLWAGLEYFQLMKFCCVFNNVFYVIILYAHPANFWLEQLSQTKERKEGRVGEESEEERVVEAIGNYQAAEVLNLQFNECCSSIMIPTFVCLSTGMHVVATFVTITFHNDMPLSGFLIFPIGFVMWCTIESDIYPLLGKIHELSQNYLVTWEPLGGRRFARHFKALFPLGVKVSNAYSIDKSTVLSVWSTVFNLVINCILF